MERTASVAIWRDAGKGDLVDGSERFVPGMFARPGGHEGEKDSLRYRGALFLPRRGAGKKNDEKRLSRAVCGWDRLARRSHHASQPAGSSRRATLSLRRAQRPAHAAAAAPA